MESTATESNAAFLLNTLNSFVSNIGLSIEKTRHLTSVLEKESKEVVKPINKAKHCLVTNIGAMMDQFKMIQCRFESKASFIKDFVKTSSQSLSLSLIKEECVMNNAVTVQQAKLVGYIEKMHKAIGVLERIKASKDFGELMRLVKEDDDATMSIDSSIDEDGDEEKDVKEEKERSLLKRKRKGDALVYNDKETIGKDDAVVKKTKKISKSITAPNKKQFSGKELLKKLKRKFNTSPYVKKLTKTFIKRRLPRKVIYEHLFQYTSDSTTVIDNKIKTIGDKASYKYCKFILDYTPSSSNPNSTAESIITYIINFYKKNYFAEISNTSIIFAGKIKESLLSIIDSIFKTNLLNVKFNITSLRVQCYEFFEELAHEFDISSSSVRSHFDDKSMNKLMDNWKMLEIVRGYVAALQEKGKK